MNPIGANTWIWVSPLTDARLAELAPRIRGWGFDVIELPIENVGDWDPGRTAELLAQLELSATTCAVMPETRDLVSSDEATVASTQEYLRACVDAAGAIGARTVAGPIYSPVGRTWLMDAAEHGATVARLVEALRPVADHAATRGVRLAIEPLNRFETSFINTVDQALEVVESLDSPWCGVAVDTFHMNIEEKDPAAAIRAAGPRLFHVQVCGNDRGSPGADHIDWRAIADALREVEYAGPICIESFTAENQTIARAAAIWRPLAPSQDRLATDGLAFLHRLLRGRTEADAGGPTVEADVTVRDANPLDAAAIADVHVRSWQAAYEPLLPADFLADLSVARREELWRESLSRQDARTGAWVAETGGSVVGFANTGPGRDDDSGADTGELYAIYLDPSTWRRGAGRALMDRAVEGLREAGFRDATLWVFEENARARGFYEAAGWRPDGRSQELHIGGVSRREVRYRRPL